MIHVNCYLYINNFIINLQSSLMNFVNKQSCTVIPNQVTNRLNANSHIVICYFQDEPYLEPCDYTAGNM